MADTLKAVVYGNNIDTDAIIAARYLNTSDPEELASHCMEDIDSGFAKKAGKECVLVAGENFGCGSSREHAPIALKAAGVKYVIAKSFARIFYRNAINTGLPIIECPKAVGAISTGGRREKVCHPAVPGFPSGDNRIGRPHVRCHERTRKR